MFLALLAGVLTAEVLMFTLASLNYATESAARCASVNSTQCGDATSISNYANSHYYSIGLPAFTYAAAACGKSVTGTATYNFNAVIFSKSIALTSSACFP